MDYARSMIAELMGPLEEAETKHYTDEDVCKNYLVSFCPHELFTNTKSDLGACHKKHLPRLKEQYTKAPESETQPLCYEAKFYEYLHQLVNDLDKRIKRGRERLDARPDESDEKVERTIMIDERMKALTNQVEAFAQEGKVDEAAELTKQVDALQAELKALKEADDTNPIFKQEKRMEVCETCGAFLVTNDTSNRLELHLEGKQHVGYTRIREALEELEKKYPAWRGGRAVFPAGHESGDHGGSYGSGSGRDDRHNGPARYNGKRDYYHHHDRSPPSRRREYDGRGGAGYSQGRRDRNGWGGGRRRDGGGYRDRDGGYGRERERYDRERHGGGRPYHPYENGRGRWRGAAGGGGGVDPPSSGGNKRYFD